MGGERGEGGVERRGGEQGGKWEGGDWSQGEEEMMGYEGEVGIKGGGSEAA